VYARWQARLDSPAWAELGQAGAQPQWLLWASTGTKNPAYSDVLMTQYFAGQWQAGAGAPFASLDPVDQRLPIPPYPHILFCLRAVLLGTIVIIPDMAELSSIFSKKLFPHYKTSYFREKSPLQADFPAVQRVGVSLFFLHFLQKIRLCPTPATGTHSLPARRPA
jgi:hypothetical protein